MKMRKILAALSASVVAVSALSIVASADVVKTEKASGGKIDNTVIDFSGLTEDQLKSATKLEAVVSGNGNYFKGVIGMNNAIEAKWVSSDENEVGDAEGANGISGTFTIEFEAGALAAVDDDGNIAPYAEVQFWWIQPAYDADGNEFDQQTVCVKAIKAYAGDEVIMTLGDESAAGPEATPLVAPEPEGDDSSTEDPATSDPATSDPATSDPATSAPAEDNSGANGEQGKDPIPTGIEGVAAVLGVAVVAAGAMVVAKKRK